MSGHQKGPPKEVAAPATGTATRHSSHHATGTAQDTPPSGNTPGASRDRRRRAAAQRSAPLDCGCRDGWICRCTDHGISDIQADAVIAAAETLLALGAPGIFDADQCRAMWRRGRRDLAVSCHNYANPKERHDRHR